MHFYKEIYNLSTAGNLVTLANSTAEGTLWKREREKTPCREHSIILQDNNIVFLKAYAFLKL